MNRNVYSLLVTTAIVCIASIVPYFLFETVLRFYFSLVTVLIIGSLVIFLGNYEKPVRITVIRPIINVYLVIGLLQVVLSALAYVMYFRSSTLFVYTELFVVMVLSTFLTGYVFLALLGLEGFFSRLELLPLSYLTGYTLSWVLFLLLDLANVQYRMDVICLSYFSLGMIFLLKMYRRGYAVKSHGVTFYQDKVILPLAAIIATYVLFLAFLYPDQSYALGSDPSRHFQYAAILSRAPRFYGMDNDLYIYLAFHLFIGLLLTFSKLNVFNFLTPLVAFNLLMPIAFYALANSYLKKLDKRLPVLSTVFFSLFAGLSWVYLAKLRLDGTSGTELDLLMTVNRGAWAGAAYSIIPMFTFTPLSISYLILIVQLLLLHKSGMAKRSFIFLFVFLSISSFLTHVTEVVVLTIIVSLYGIFRRARSDDHEVRTNDVLISLSLGSGIGLGILVALIWMFSWSAHIALFVLTGSLALLAYLVYLVRTRASGVMVRMTNVLKKLSRGRALVQSPAIICYGVLCLYLLGLFVWISEAPTLNSWIIIENGNVPWFIYPLILGITGLLGIFGLLYVSDDRATRSTLSIFIAITLFSLILGKALNFLNAYVFYSYYHEKRVVSFIFLALSMLASIPVLRFYEHFTRRQGSILSSRKIFAIVFLSVVITFGIQSLYAIVEFNYVSNSSRNKPSDGEIVAVEYMRSMLLNDKYAYVLATSSRTRDLLVFAGPLYQEEVPHLDAVSKWPHDPILSFNHEGLSHPYLFMTGKDLRDLDQHEDSWMKRHLLEILPVVYKNNDVTIFNIPKMSFPSVNSSTALIVPIDERVDQSEPWLYAFDMLSLGKYNYTVAYDLDPEIFSYKTLVTSIDPPGKGLISQTFESNFTRLERWRNLTGYWQGTDQGLRAGHPRVGETNMILSPVKVNDFTASLSFRILGRDPNVLNYVSLLYDWRGENDFKYAGLTFSDKGLVYARFVTYKDGEVIAYPSDLGLQTGLKWSLGDSYNLTISRHEEEAVLYVNGVEYLKTKSVASGGRLGISTERFSEVLFTSFKTLYSTRIDSRDPSEYLDYVRTGGRLIILNTNGYGYFAERMLSTGNSTVISNKINGSENIQLPFTVVVPRLGAKLQGSDIIAKYSSQQGSSVYSVKESLGAGEIIYLNVRPICEAMGLETNNRDFFETLGKLLKPTNTRATSKSHSLLESIGQTKPETAAAFRQVNMSGDIQVFTSAVVFPPQLKLEKVECVNRSNVISLSNVTGIQLMSSQENQIRTSSLTVDDGNGFYSVLNIGGKAEILFKYHDASVVIATSDGNETRISGVRRITVENDGPITFNVKQPQIRVQGTISFKELYSGGDFWDQSKTYGQNLKVDGQVEFDVYVSDTYTWLNSLEGSGDFERKPPPYQYQEFVGLRYGAFWILVLAPVFLAFILFCLRDDTRSQTETIDQCR